MFITELDVVNKCLASMGELPINSIANSTNPMVTNARQSFKDAVIAEQGAGWWYNTEEIKLLPQVDQTYLIPSDTLSLSAQQTYTPKWLTIRGNKLYDTAIGDWYYGTNAIRVKIIRALPFEDLPYNAQKLVRAATVSKFQLDFDGDQAKQAAADTEYQESYALCMMDHTRSVGANMLAQGGTGQARVRALIAGGRWRP